jgi:predicted component of viral defense system (DUF524 family)
MIQDPLEISIPVNKNEEIKLYIRSLKPCTSFFLDPEIAYSYGEAPYQILEGQSYHYKIQNDYSVQIASVGKEAFGIVTPNKFENNIGIISPNTYVGTLVLGIFFKDETEPLSNVKIEVRSSKADYREDYRKMLANITEHAVDLIFQHSSPVTQSVEVDFEKDPETLYQRFAFIKSVLDSEEFKNAVNKIVSSPVTRWIESEIEKDIRGIGRLNHRGLRQIASATNRIMIPMGHPLRYQNIESVPLKIKTAYKKETIDTPENRFVKHALNSFLSFVGRIRALSEADSRIFMEASKLERRLEQMLGHSVFKEISEPQILSLNNPVLQRKEGYREILRVWLMFDLAAKLVWHGGDDVYGVGKRNVAVLYEYWLFFVLLDIIKEVFGIEPKKDLIVDTNDRLCLQLRQGKHFPIEGVCEKKSRKLNIQFSYNRTFSGKMNYPDGGSWTKNMRPDYTLSIWPFGIGSDKAEEEELIVHIHFDAKYRVDKLTTIFGDENNDDDEERKERLLNEEKEEQNRGNYKRADLLKMHSYKDAIRRTAGAYILYPGDEMSYKGKGFHELLPGLGAFAIDPSPSNNGKQELTSFLEDVVTHFINKASQREKASFEQYLIHKNAPHNEDKVEEPIPEEYGSNRIIPDDTYVLIAFCKSEAHLKWVRNAKLYNARIGNKINDITLNKKGISAKYILLHLNGTLQSNEIYELKDEGTAVFTNRDLKNKNYPTDPKVGYYLVYKFENDVREGFGNLTWDISKLVANVKTRKIRKPFAVSISELMKAKNSVI